MRMDSFQCFIHGKEKQLKFRECLSEVVSTIGMIYQLVSNDLSAMNLMNISLLFGSFHPQDFPISFS